MHANVLDVLVHLRLRSELSRHVRQGPMGAPTAAESRRADPRQVRKGLAVHRSKKQAKRDRHVRQIESEMREAEATLDLEEREKRQSETLKLVFALYIRILKTDDVPVPLLASALEGIVHFAHHVSADFFRDLVGTAVHGCVVGSEELPFRVQNLHRALSGGTGIQVHQLLPLAYCARKDREVAADLRGIQGIA